MKMLYCLLHRTYILMNILFNGLNKIKNECFDS
jgi:hypothetical protein